ncbi:hypothetical protein KJ590_04325, partial [Patescibacteria group bacterium]|nr:hypothetical protein [Patescibacteria group bacterium]
TEKTNFNLTVSGETGLLDSKTNGNPQRYWFKFLTPSDCDDFFQAGQSGNYRRWRSELVNMMG